MGRVIQDFMRKNCMYIAEVTVKGRTYTAFLPTRISSRYEVRRAFLNQLGLYVAEDAQIKLSTTLTREEMNRTDGWVGSRKR